MNVFMNNDAFQRANYSTPRMPAFRNLFAHLFGKCIICVNLFSCFNSGSEMEWSKNYPWNKWITLYFPFLLKVVFSNCFSFPRKFDICQITFSGLLDVQLLCFLLLVNILYGVYRLKSNMRFTYQNIQLLCLGRFALFTKIVTQK